MMNYSTFLTFIIMGTFYSLSASLPNFIVVGVPGSGKGTFSQYLKEHYGYHQVSIGDLIRSHIRNETDLGQQIKEIVQKGEYIDDTITAQLITNKIEEFNRSHVPFIIDGYPRSHYCLDKLNTLLHELGLSNTVHCVNINASDNICAERISKRLICLNCARVTSTEQCGETAVPKCICGSNLSKRDFDEYEITIKRINHYRTSIEPLVEKLKIFYPYHFFNTECSLTKCHHAYDTLITVIS